MFSKSDAFPQNIDAADLISELLAKCGGRQFLDGRYKSMGEVLYTCTILDSEKYWGEVDDPQEILDTLVNVADRIVPHKIYLYVRGGLW